LDKSLKEKKLRGSGTRGNHRFRKKKQAGRGREKQPEGGKERAQRLMKTKKQRVWVSCNDAFPRAPRFQQPSSGGDKKKKKEIRGRTGALTAFTLLLKERRTEKPRRKKLDSKGRACAGFVSIVLRGGGNEPKGRKFCSQSLRRRPSMLGWGSRTRS